MVTKLRNWHRQKRGSLSLTKIHMVTKHGIQRFYRITGLSLTKIHMVTKQWNELKKDLTGLSLTKIHMVTKLY